MWAISTITQVRDGLRMYPVEPRETTQARWRLARNWLTRRSPRLIFLRVYSQLKRRFTGIPPRRYSQITPNLYVCGQHDARGLEALKTWGITGIVNLRQEFDDQKAGIAPECYLHLPTEDNTAPSQEHLRQGVDFIKSEIERGGAVYIHCGVGVGRAPTLAAAYLVSIGMTPENAWQMIRRARPFIWPNRRQIASVRNFAEGMQ